MRLIVFANLGYINTIWWTDWLNMTGHHSSTDFLDCLSIENSLFSPRFYVGWWEMGQLHAGLCKIYCTNKYICNVSACFCLFWCVFLPAYVVWITWNTKSHMNTGCAMWMTQQSLKPSHSFHAHFCLGKCFTIEFSQVKGFDYSAHLVQVSQGRGLHLQTM